MIMKINTTKIFFVEKDYRINGSHLKVFGLEIKYM